MNLHKEHAPSGRKLLLSHSSLSPIPSFPTVLSFKTPNVGSHSFSLQLSLLNQRRVLSLWFILVSCKWATLAEKSEGWGCEQGWGWALDLNKTGCPIPVWYFIYTKKHSANTQLVSLVISRNALPSQALIFLRDSTVSFCVKKKNIPIVNVT